jgi:hypothetical protein
MVGWIDVISLLCAAFPKNTMDVLKSVNVAAVQSTWAIVKKDINTHAPNFYVA